MSERTTGISENQDTSKARRGEVLTGKSFLLFGPTNPFRLLCRNVLYSSAGEIFVQLCIVLSVISYAMSRPEKIQSKDMDTYDIVLYYVDLAFLVIFTIELLMRCVVEGVFGKDGFFSNSWNRVDFIVVTTGWMYFLFFAWVRFRGFRAFRALRPMLGIRYLEGVQAILSSLGQSLPLIIDVGALIVFSLVVFGVVGIQIYGGSFQRRCVNTEDYQATGSASLSGSWPEPGDFCKPAASSEWMGYSCDSNQVCLTDFGNPNFGYTSFDHMGVAAFTIFLCTSLEGWTNIMYWAMDSEYKFSWLYFILLIVFVSFLVVNLFVAVINETFGQVRKEQCRVSAFSAEERDDCVEGGNSSKTEAQTDDHKETNDHETDENETDLHGLRKVIHRIYLVCKRIVKSKSFERVIIVVILVNTALMASEYDGMSKTHSHILDTSEYVFVSIFVVEFLLKWVGLNGFANYWKERMNRFDFIILVVSIAALFASDLSSLRVLRILRPLRVVRLMALQGQLRQLLDTVLGSMVAIVNLLGFIFLSLIVFGILGMDLFGGHFKREDGEYPRANFDNFATSVLTLFTVLTSENWLAPMFDGMRWFSVWGSPIFFISFFIFGSYILLNLFVAVILENFEIGDSEKQVGQIEKYEREMKKKKKREGVAVPTTISSDKALLEALSSPAPVVQGRKRACTFAPRALQRELALHDAQLVMNQMNASTKNLQQGHSAGNSPGSPPGSGRVGEKVERRRSSFTSKKPKKASKTSPKVRVRSHSTVHRKEVNSTAVSHSTVHRKEASSTAVLYSYDPDEDADRFLSVPEDNDAIKNDFDANSLDGVDVVAPPKEKDKNDGGKELKSVLFDEDVSHVESRRIEHTLKATPRGVPSGFRAIFSCCLIHKSHSEEDDLGEQVDSDTDSEDETEDDESEELEEKPSLPRTGAMFESMLHGFRSVGNFLGLSKPERVLYCLEPNNGYRKICESMLKSKWFDRFIVAVIVFSSLLLALEGPPSQSDDNERDYTSYMTIIDLFFIIVFSLEFLLKISARGLIFTKQAYFKDGYNFLDFAVLVVTYIYFFVGGLLGNAGRALRVLRALRPLRLLSKNEGMRMIVESIIASMPAIFYVVLLLFFVLMIFSIVGLGLFSGKFYQCNNPDATGEDDCLSVMTTSLGVVVPQVWSNPPFSFDNVFKALFTLFEISSLEGWLDIMYLGIDVTEKGRQPRRNHSWPNAFYFVAFIVISSFFFFQLFIGVFTNNFNKFRGTALLTDVQRAWVDFKRLIDHIKPIRLFTAPENKVRKFFFQLVQTKKFEAVIMFIIVLNVVFMSCEYYGQPDSWTRMLKIANYVFVSIFLLEMMLKLIGLGRQYFTDNWNIFDFIVVIGSTLAIVIEEVSGSSVMGLGFARIFRIARVFRLINRAKGLQFLFNTLLISLPSFANVAVLFLLLLFLYAIIGVQLFGNVRFQKSLNRHANFRSFGSGLLVLFRMVTGEDWNAIMHDCEISSPNCLTTNDYDDCGSTWISVCFYSSFYVLAGYLFLNLVISLVLDNFGQTVNTEESVISTDDIEHFRYVWHKKPFDPDGKGRMPVKKLRLFIVALREPLGFDTISGSDGESRYDEIRFEVSKVANDGYVQFNDILKILVVNVLPLEHLEFQYRLARESELGKMALELAAVKISTVFKKKSPSLATTRRSDDVEDDKVVEVDSPKVCESGEDPVCSSSSQMEDLRVNRSKPQLSESNDVDIDRRKEDLIKESPSATSTGQSMVPSTEEPQNRTVSVPHGEFNTTSRFAVERDSFDCADILDLMESSVSKTSRSDPPETKKDGNDSKDSSGSEFG